MNLLRDAPPWALILLAVLLLAAAGQDVAQRKISNFLCLGVILLAAAAAIAIGPTLALWQNALMFVLLLALGLPLFATGWLGGGDVKLFAALGLWTDLAVAVPLVSCILIAGGVIALLSIVLRGAKAVRHSKGVPYGVAIAAGAAVLLLQPIVFPRHAANPLDLKAARAQYQR
jgi:prepilin peptidase CpaA